VLRISRWIASVSRSRAISRRQDVVEGPAKRETEREADGTEVNSGRASCDQRDTPSSPVDLIDRLVRRRIDPENDERPSSEERARLG
jgi:hypothetical protein